MFARTEQYATRRDTLIFVVCLVLSILLRFSPASVTDSLATGIISTVLRPLLILQENAAAQKNSRFNYEQVVRERDSLAVAAARLSLATAENRQFRETLELGRTLPIRHVSAEVLYESAPAEGLTALLSVGSRDGVTILSPVIAPDGLVGVVESVAEGVSVVALWPHPEFRVNVMTEDATLFGNARVADRSGTGFNLMEISGVQYGDEVAPGTLVYTSGLGGVWPRGIVVGTVLQDTSEPGGWERTYLVKPNVHPASLANVIVLLEPVADLRSWFQTRAGVSR